MTRFDKSRLGRIGTVGRRYVDKDLLPCSVVQIADRDGIIYRDAYGFADVETGKAVAYDSIFRIFSMTKPITSIITMQLYEEGLLLLEDPVENYLPEMNGPVVHVGGNDLTPVTRPATRSVTIHDLLTHTSGLTYGFMRQNAIDARYRKLGLGDFSPAKYSLSEATKLIGAQPLLFDPGTAWNYSMSTDVLGAVIEQVTGKPLDQAFASRIFEPLGMSDTGFQVRQDQAHRFTSLYTPSTADGIARIESHESSPYLKDPVFLSGGGGLVSTIDDYQRFASMLLAGGIGLSGSRIIGRHTLEYMTKNHLPDNKTLNELGQSFFSETDLAGMGFGLGFSIVCDPVACTSLCSAGEFAWGGAASTAFFIDPSEGITGIFMTQLLPSGKYPLRRRLRGAVYQALM